MNSKRIGVVFLLQILGYFLLMFGIAVYYMAGTSAREIGIVENLIIAQSVNVIPLALVILVGCRKYRGEKIFRDTLGFRRIKISTALMTVLYAFLLMPLTTLANAISMIFVDNVVADLAGDILDVPFVVMFLIMAVFGPFCEEVVFRGAFFRGFRRSGNIFGAVLMSGLLFALMHMNLNQAEAADSTLAPLIVHIVFNGQSVCLMYLEDRLFPELMEEELAGFNNDPEELVLVIAVYLLLAVICTAIAFCVVTWIASNEGKQNFLRTIWASRKIKRERLWSVCLVIGVTLAVLYILFETVFSAMLL